MVKYILMGLLTMLNANMLWFSASSIPTDYLARYVASNISGSTLIDLSANSYDGTIVGAKQSASELLYFNGTSSDYVTVTTLKTALQATASGTFAMQFMVPSGGTSYFGFGESTGNGFIQFLINEGSMIFAYKYDASATGPENFSVRYDGAVLSPNTFYNAVFVSDATSGIKLFVEGVGELTPTSTTGTPGDRWFDNQTLLDTGRLQSLDYGGTDLYYESYLVSATFYGYVMNAAGINKLLSLPHPVITFSDMFGDSITVGYGATTYADSWAGKWETDYVVDNSAVNGDQAGDMSYNIQTNYTSTSDKIYTVMIGTNDHRTYKTDTAKQGYFKAFVRQSLAWLALPTRTIARDAAMTKTGSWANTGANSIGMYTTVTGDTAQATISGTGVYIGYIIQNSASAHGTAEVRIDGNLVGTIDCYGVMDTINGRTFAPAAAYFGGLTDTAHTVLITVTSSGQNFYLDYMAGSPQTPPKIITSNIIKMTAAAYTTYGTSEANVITYNGIISDVITEFTTDGVAISTVDNFTAIDPTLHLIADGVHPNDTGYGIIYNTFVGGL